MNNEFIDKTDSSFRSYKSSQLKEEDSIESVDDKTTALNNLRTDLQDELHAVKGYDAHADFAEKLGWKDVAEVLRDIRDEEKVHIGELQKLLDKYDKEFEKSVEDGKEEAGKELNEEVATQIPITESAKDWVNDKGEKVPKKCTKCGSDVKIFLRGEPVWLCSNKDCEKYFGTVPFSDSLSESKKSYYKPCPYCGANLDPGETCDCQKEKTTSENNKKPQEVKPAPTKELSNGQLAWELKESRLPSDGRDPQFGVPEQEKYPLFDEAHVRSAIKLFGHVEPQYERELAMAIIVKMRKYGIPFSVVTENNKLYKYIPEKFKNQ